MPTVLVVDLQAEATVELVVKASQYLKNALDHANHLWARWNLPRQHRVILKRFLEAEGKNEVDTMMTSFTEKAITSTIDALERVDDPKIQAVAKRMQSKQSKQSKQIELQKDADI
uniref:Uncharacterized protein n=1 Tax=Hyaloperonospora arabidopsidis (strain Emoy2) TaxID=559515 RepID=M4C0U8_HYAAE